LGSKPTAPTDLVKEFQSGSTALTQTKPKRYARKPIVIFLLAVFGIPYIVNRLFRRIHEHQQQRQQLGQHQLPPSTQDKITVQFARALHDFTAESPNEISFQRGNYIAVLSQTDPMTGQPSPWWQGKKQHGPMGYFPANHVELVGKSVDLNSNKTSDGEKCDEQTPSWNATTPTLSASAVNLDSNEMAMMDNVLQKAAADNDL
jgi:peroxin-13